MEADEVKTALHKVVPGVVSRVTKFTTKFSIKNSYDTGLYLVSLNPGKTLSDISHLKNLLNQTVLWEKPKKKSQEIQCHRCQRWGHIAKNCNSEYQCVKCDKKHPHGECQRSSSESSPPYCVNCGQSGHPANFRGCPTYKKFVTVRKDQQGKAREEKLTATANVARTVTQSLRSPEKTFASLFHGSNQATSKPSIVNDFLKLVNIFLVPEELPLEQQISNFLLEYKKMPQHEAKTEFLRLLSKVNSKYGP